MAQDDKDTVYPLARAADTTGRNIVSLEGRSIIDDEASRESIRKMAEFGNLTYQQMGELGIIHPGMKSTAVLNSFRELRTRIYQTTATKENFVLMTTSITPGGGGSFVTINLGAAIALDESKTAIIVDCNIDDPSLQRILPIDPDYGLVDYLENVSLDIKDVIYSTGVRRLRMIPAGVNQQPGREFFTSSRMRRFLDELKTRYRDRNIIVDAPSIGNSADARILANLCDYVLLVVPFGRVTESQVAIAVDSLGEDKVVGVVFNN